jgi:hypothetical protein
MKPSYYTASEALKKLNEESDEGRYARFGVRRWRIVKLFVILKILRAQSWGRGRRFRRPRFYATDLMSEFGGHFSWRPRYGTTFTQISERGHFARNQGRGQF